MIDERIDQKAGDNATQIGQVAGNVNIAQKITNYIFGMEVESRNQRNRRDMLRLVRDFWVKGVLEQSLYGASFIELGFEKLEDVIDRPWDMGTRQDFG